MHIKNLLIAGTFILAAPVAAGCGSSDSGDKEGAGENDDSGQASAPAPTTTQTTKPSAVGRALTVDMTEFAFTPKDNVAKAGKVTIAAPNVGKVVHELVVLKTNADPAKLPKEGDEVDESTSVGEIADVEPGATKKVKINLTPGKYALVCALPGHYEAGMYGSLTVE